MRRALLAFLVVSCLAEPSANAQSRRQPNAAAAKPPANEAVPVTFLEKNSTFDVNARFTIPVDAGKRVTGNPQLLVRLFAGTPEALINQLTMRSKENCRVYKSTVITIDPFEEMLDLDYRLDETYLRRDASGFHDTPYVLVIERGESADNIALIDDSAVVDYFNQGFQFVLKARRASLTPRTQERLDASELRKRNRERQWKRALEKGLPGACLMKTR